MMTRIFIALLLFVSASVFAVPPYSGTLWVDSGVLTADDPSTFIQAIPAGVGSRQMFDRRVNDWVVLDAFLFNALYTDGDSIEVIVNPEFTAAEALEKAQFYGHAIGQLPLMLRVDVKTSWIHKGDQAFGGGNNNILIHTDAAGYHGVWLEETLFHEACHTSLDSRLAQTADWLNAQSLDGEFISTYSRDNPLREDVAESCLMHFALRHRGERISENVKATVNTTIPNRLLVLDGLNIKPIANADRVASFDAGSQQLQIPGVKVGDLFYALTLGLVDPVGLVFRASAAAQIAPASFNLQNVFETNVLTVPNLLVGDKRYSATFDLTGADPIEFRLSSAVEAD